MLQIIPIRQAIAPRYRSVWRRDKRRARRAGPAHPRLCIDPGGDRAVQCAIGALSSVRNVAHHLRPEVMREAAHYRRLGRRRHAGSIRFCPQAPRDSHVMWKVCHLLGLAVVRERRADTRASFLWHDDTRIDPRQAEAGMLNGRCVDISKIRVDRAMAGVFGYGVTVDPVTLAGPCVEKSDLNGAHDGRIIRCPTPARDGRVYQRVIDNRIAGGMVEDLRVAVMGARLPLVYVKHRPERSRFSNINSAVRVAMPDEVLGAEEQHLLRRVADRIGLDVGEMDVLRDRRDHRIYVVDVNRTCYGPPNHLARDAGRAAVRTLALAFAELLGGV